MSSGQMAKATLPLNPNSEDYLSLRERKLYLMEILAEVGFMRSEMLRPISTLYPRLTPKDIILLLHECLFTSEKVLSCKLQVLEILADTAVQILSLLFVTLFSSPKK